MNKDTLIKNVNIKEDFVLKKIEWKLFVASKRGKRTIKYLIPRVKIGSTKFNYREDTTFLNNIIKKIQEKGYIVMLDDYDLAHYHVIYVGY